MPYNPFNWTREDLETQAKYWMSKASKTPGINALYELLGGDQYPSFSVPATFVLADLVFKTIPGFLFNKYVLDKEPEPYLLLFGVAMQIVASIPVALYKERMKKITNTNDDGNMNPKGPHLV